ncbi:MAG: PaREP1 family protein [Sulfolobales archaeon]|nr:PaREP1 family protein [Sulfolobales archaeon]MCG2883723.1 PaREP1 family protein [Sulfolobales archaeon]MCG2908365.1 PaREP1 family protein [Sulfolobales archaeon]
MQVLPKPWFNLEAYKKIRLEEARFEVEIAEKFLQEGLIRNAAGKAFQAWKSLLAALLTEKRVVLVKKYPKKKSLGRRKIEFADWIIAVVPTSYLEELSLILGKEINLLTEKALSIHVYQYNGPDKEAILSPFRSDEIAVENIKMLIDEIKSILQNVQK